jgi:hypothetical protein
MWRMAKEITKMARGGSKYHGVMKANEKKCRPEIMAS